MDFKIYWCVNTLPWFLANKTNKLYSLYLKGQNENNAKLIVDTTNKKVAKGLAVSENGKINFSRCSSSFK